MSATAADTTHNMISLLDDVATVAEEVDWGVELCWNCRSVRVMADDTISQRHRAMNKGVLLEFVNLVSVALPTKDHFCFGDLPALRCIFAVVTVNALKNPFRPMHKRLIKHSPMTRPTGVIFG